MSSDSAGAGALLVLLGLGLAAFLCAALIGSRESELCTLAFSHAESRLDSLEVTVTYDYCELPEDG